MMKKIKKVIWPALGAFLLPAVLTALIYWGYDHYNRPRGAVQFWELALAWTARLSVPALGVPFFLKWISRLQAKWAKVLGGVLFLAEVGFLFWLVYVLTDICIYLFR